MRGYAFLVSAFWYSPFGSLTMLFRGQPGLLAPCVLAAEAVSVICDVDAVCVLSGSDKPLRSGATPTTAGLLSPSPYYGPEVPAARVPAAFHSNIRRQERRQRRVLSGPAGGATPPMSA